jgi:hypothetical protein
MSTVEHPADELTWDEKAELTVMVGLSWLFVHRREVEGAYSVNAASHGVTVQAHAPQMLAILRHFPEATPGRSWDRFRAWTLPRQMVAVEFIEDNS